MSRPPQQCAHAREELVWRERLCHVIISSLHETLNYLVFLIAFRHDHQREHSILLTYPLANPMAIVSRERGLHHNQVDGLRLQDIECHICIRCRMNLVAVLIEQEREQREMQRVFVEHQYGGHSVSPTQADTK